MSEQGRGAHDLGGLPGGPVVSAQHDPELWEKRVDALMVLLSGKGLFTVDELRRSIEQLGPGAYEELSYYERWIAAISSLMLEKGMLTTDELGRRMTEVEARHDAEGG